MTLHKVLTLSGLSYFKDKIISIIEDNESNTAAAVTDLNDRVTNLELNEGGSSDANVQAVTYNFDDWMNEPTKRSVRDAVDLTTGEKIYFTGLADVIQYQGGMLIDYINDKAAAARIIKWDVEAGDVDYIPEEVYNWIFTQEGILILNGSVAILCLDEDLGLVYIQSDVVKEGNTVITKVCLTAGGYDSDLVTIDSYPISGGGSSNANVQAVDTGDVIDDVTVNYATTAYVNGLIGDINSVLESIINGGGNVSIFPITLSYNVDGNETYAKVYAELDKISNKNLSSVTIDTGLIYIDLTTFAIGIDEISYEVSEILFEGNNTYSLGTIENGPEMHTIMLSSDGKVWCQTQ